MALGGAWGLAEERESVVGVVEDEGVGCVQEGESFAVDLMTGAEDLRAEVQGGLGF